MKLALLRFGNPSGESLFDVDGVMVFVCGGLLSPIFLCPVLKKAKNIKNKRLYCLRLLA